MPQRQLFPSSALVILILSIVAITNNVAFASPIALGTWYEFGFEPGHLPQVDGCLPVDPTGVACRAPDPGVVSSFLDSPPWTFSSPIPSTFTITDAFLSGDSFQVFDNGPSIGSTNVVPMFGGTCGI